MNYFTEDDIDAIVQLLTEIRDLLEEQQAIEFIPDFNMSEQEH